MVKLITNRTPQQSEKFSEIAEFKNGLNYSRKSLGQGLKIIGVGDFRERQVPDFDVLDELCGFDNIAPDCLLQEQDLLFVRSNGSRKLVGRVLEIKNIHERVTHSGFTIRARVTSQHALPGYVACFTRSHRFKEELRKNSGGTNITNLSQKVLGNVVVHLPPYDEQRRIVAVLDTAEQVLQTLEALIAKKEAFRVTTAERLLAAANDESWQLHTLREFFAEINVRPKTTDPIILSCSTDFQIN